MSGLAQRYAKAILDTAADAKGCDALVHQMALLVPHLGHRSPLLGRLMQSSATEALPSDVMQTFSKLQLSPNVVGLIRVLLRNRRLDHYADVVEAARLLADAKASRARAEVISAIALSDAQRDRLEATLSKRLGLKVVAQIKVDPSLGAGLVCHVGQVTIDSSLTSQLRRLAQLAI